MEAMTTELMIAIALWSLGSGLLAVAQLYLGYGYGLNLAGGFVPLGCSWP